MKHRHRDLRGATVKLKCGRVFTIPTYYLRNPSLNGTSYCSFEEACEIQDPQSIHRVVKFPDRKLPHGRDLRGCAVWLRNGKKIHIPLFATRNISDLRYVHYYIPWKFTVFDDRSLEAEYKHVIIRYRRKE